MHRLPHVMPPIVFAGAVAASIASGAAFESYEDFHSQWSRWRVDSTRVARVQSLILERDAGTLVLEEGRLAFAVPLGGHTCAAVFVGRGTFSFTPRDPVERGQVERFYGTPTLRRPFRALTLVFGDSTARELESALSFERDTMGALGRAWLSTHPFRTARTTLLARPIPAALSVLEGGGDGLFWAHFTLAERNEPLFFMLDPTANERVRLLRRPEDDRLGLYRRHDTETVAQFHAQGERTDEASDQRLHWEARHIEVEVDLAPDLSLAAVATLTMTTRQRARAWLPLWLHDDLRIDSVRVDGVPQQWFQEAEDNPLVWVRCDPPIAPGREASVRVSYRGKILSRRDDFVFHLGTTDWYPSPWFSSKVTWDVRFTHPASLQLLAAGERIEHEVRGQRASSRWVTRHRVPWSSFDINFLRGIEVVGDSLLPVTSWMRRLDGAGRVRSTTLAALADAPGREERVARDLARCVQFFRTAFGDPVATRFHAVETPLMTYEAYPGLIHMMLAEDRSRLPAGAEYTPDLIRAHEVAHQWWGLSVDPATYRDSWLSEGFADFCSIWYLQAGRQDARTYFDVLRNWRERLVGNRRFLLGGGQEAGPIALGPRTHTSATPGDYSLIIYKKGAWVLHMLRNLLLDPAAPDESRFRGLMRDFHERHRGGTASSADFRAAVERTVGEDMGWFFRQWVEGTDLPRYEVAWTRSRRTDGRWTVRLRVGVSQVPADFRAPVFVRVDYGDDRFARERLWVKGAGGEYELPDTALEPRDIVFNDLESVLCEVRSVAWK